MYFFHSAWVSAYFTDLEEKYLQCLSKVKVKKFGHFKTNTASKISGDIFWPFHIQGTPVPVPGIVHQVVYTVRSRKTCYLCNY